MRYRTLWSTRLVTMSALRGERDRLDKAGASLHEQLGSYQQAVASRDQAWADNAKLRAKLARVEALPNRWRNEEGQHHLESAFTGYDCAKEVEEALRGES
jgi:hypothetical protein